MRRLGRETLGLLLGPLVVVVFVGLVLQELVDLVRYGWPSPPPEPEDACWTSHVEPIWEHVRGEGL